jgi:filamentous hemagglutinin family protein
LKTLRPRLLLCTLIEIGIAHAAGPAGVKLDGSLGGSATTLQGPTFNITQGLGTLAGGNLFFSFQYFNIGTGQTALFSTTTAGIGNVISRVTGAYSSTIDGTIKLLAASGAPNFFLINPNGVTFTANGAIDVPAGFYVTTANYLTFRDGRFYADPSKTSSLSTAAPEAFGFLGTTRAPVNVTGAALAAGPADNGQAPLQIAAGDITIDGAGAIAGIANTTGGVRLIATGAQSTEVPLSGTFNSTDGTVTIQNGGTVQTAGIADAPAGSIYVSAGALQIRGQGAAVGSALGTFVNGSGGSAAVTINVSGTVLLDGGGDIFADVTTGGNSGDINLSAGSLTIKDPSASAPTGLLSFGGGINVKAGTLDIDASGATLTGPMTGISSQAGNAAGRPVSVQVAGAATLSNGGAILTSTVGPGSAADITLTAASLEINGNGFAASPLESGILSLSEYSPVTAGTGLAGNSGHISVTTTGATKILAGGEILTSTYTGNTGGVDLSVGSLTIDGGATPATTAIESNADTLSTGSAGAVSVESAGAITLSNGGQIASFAGSSAYSNGIALKAGSLTIDGAGSATNSTGIMTTVDSTASANAAAVSITTSGLTSILNGGVIHTETLGSATAGNVNLTVGSLNIDGGLSALPTGLLSSTDAGANGGSGQILITATGPVTLATAGRVDSNTRGSGDAGDITLSAESLDINGSGLSQITGISSTSYSGTGHSGNVSIATTGATMLANGASILTTSDGPGDAGNITITANSLSASGGPSGIATPIAASAEATNSSANSGAVSITTIGATTLTNGGAILTATAGLGNAGDVTVTAGSLMIAGSNTGISSGADYVPASATNGLGGSSGKISVTTSGATTLSDGGLILSNTNDSGNSGGVSLVAGSLSIDGSGASAQTGISTSATYSTGNAGPVLINTPGAITLSNGGAIASNAQDIGNAGDITIRAGSLTILGGEPTFFNEITGVSSSAESGSIGNAGKISVTAGGTISVSDGGEIVSSTRGAGNAGTVTVDAAMLSVAGGTSPALTEISSAALGGSSGHAGEVSVDTTGLTTISNGGEILSNTHGSGNAGDVTVQAGGLTINGEASTILTGISSSAETGSSGNAGKVSVTSGGETLLTDGGEIISSTFSSGDGGDLTLKTGLLTIEQGTSNTDSGLFSTAGKASTGNAGNVCVVAGSLTMGGRSPTGALAEISSSANLGSTGNAGTVSVSTTGSTLISAGGEILSATFAAGNAGSVHLTSGSLTIDGAASPSPTGIFTGAHQGSSGTGGAVTVDVTGVAKLLNGGQINSQTQIDSSGQPGSVSVTAGKLVLGSNGLITIENDATVADPRSIEPTLIDIHAGSIQLQGGAIDAASTGNIGASSIDLHYASSLFLDPSTISTTSNQGNGGAITIIGQGPLWLTQSSITTSVTGTTIGNGGDITIQVPAVIFNTGAIQANSVAPRASGGDVTIDAPTLIASFQSFTRGGALVNFADSENVAGLNLVQATAPDGVSGSLSVTTPNLQVQNSLTRLSGSPATPIVLGRSPCRYRPGSSLSLAGRGGLPLLASEALWADIDGASEEPHDAGISEQAERSRERAQGDTAIACL